MISLTSRRREYPRHLPPFPLDPKDQHAEDQALGHINPRKKSHLTRRLSHIVVLPEANVLAL